MKRLLLGSGIALSLVGLFMNEAAAQDKKLTGAIKCGGSSTVYLITEAVASKFKKLHAGVNVSIGIEGTGGGMRKFINGELDICNASRKMKDGEATDCKKAAVEFIELQVAWDGLAVVVTKKNDFATKLTMQQLKKIWHPDTKEFTNAKTWKDVDPSFPNEPLDLWGAGKDSGTFDFFTEAVNKKERLIRQDYKGSENDNELVTGVSRNTYAMGFFGLAYYAANKGRLNVVAIASESGKPYIEPNLSTVRSREYPISRPLYIYVRKDSLKRAEMREFVEFYLRSPDLATSAGYVQLDVKHRLAERKKFEAAVK